MVCTPNPTRVAIIALHLAGEKPATIARELHIKADTASKWIKRFQLTGEVQPKRSSGRPRVLSAEAAKEAVEMLTSGQYSGAAAVARELHCRGLAPTTVAPSTLIRTARGEAKAQGDPIAPFRGRPAKQLSEGTKAKRVSFAKQHKRRAWDNTMFTDRKRFLWKHPGTAIKRVVWLRGGKQFTAYTASHPKGVNVYAGVTKYGVTKAHFVTGTHKQLSGYENKRGERARNITAAEYEHVLKTTLLPEGCRMFGVRGVLSWELQQDNDPTHRAASTHVATYNKGTGSSIKLLGSWPPHSPDLSPIENVWGYVQARVDARGCKTFEEFKLAVEEELAAVPRSVCSNLIKSMTKRLAKVIELGGERTKY